MRGGISSSGFLFGTSGPPFVATMSSQEARQGPHNNQVARQLEGRMDDPDGTRRAPKQLEGTPNVPKSPTQPKPAEARN